MLPSDTTPGSGPTTEVQDAPRIGLELFDIMMERIMREPPRNFTREQRRRDRECKWLFVNDLHDAYLELLIRAGYEEEEREP